MRYSYAVERLWHGVSVCGLSVCLPVTDVLWLNGSR